MPHKRRRINWELAFQEPLVTDQLRFEPRSRIFPFPRSSRLNSGSQLRSWKSPGRYYRLQGIVVAGNKSTKAFALGHSFGEHLVSLLDLLGASAYLVPPAAPRRERIFANPQSCQRFAVPSPPGGSKALSHFRSSFGVGPPPWA